jgi:uncharacterized protein YeeX (DUF496 family)
MEFTIPNGDETEAVARLKVRLSEENISHPFTETAILRFLRGRKHDEAKALKGLTKHVEWRNENNVDGITIEDIPHEHPSRKCIIEGYDFKGRPVTSIIARRHNKDARDVEEIKKYIIHTLESAMKMTKDDEERMVVLFDLSEFSLRCMDYEAVQMLVNILQYNYPETLAYALIVNAPMIFSACWAVIKLWVDPVTVSKVLFVSHRELAKYMDPSQIPADIAGGAAN